MALPDAVAQALMGEIDEQLAKLTAMAAAIEEAARIVNEAKVISFERNEAQLKHYADKLLEFTAKQADRLAEITNQGINGMSAVADAEHRKLGQYAGSLRNAIVRDLSAEVLTLVRSELGQINAVVHQFKPALDGYAARIAQLSSELDGYAIKSAVRSREASAEAAKLLVETTTAQMGRLYAQTWLFCGVSALVGGVVALLGYVLLK